MSRAVNDLGFEDRIMSSKAPFLNPNDQELQIRVWVIPSLKDIALCLRFVAAVSSS